MNFKTQIFKDLHSKLVSGEISVNECYTQINAYRDDRYELKQVLEAMKIKEYSEKAQLRRELYERNKEYYELYSRLSQAWRDGHLIGYNVKEQILYLTDEELNNIYLDKLDTLDLNSKLSLKELIKIPLK